MPFTTGIVGGAGNLKNPAQPWLLGYRSNLAENPSFEVDTTKWEGGAGGVLSRVTSEFFTGTASLQVENASASYAQLGNVSTYMVPLVLGEGDYVISAYVKLASGNSGANYFLRYLQYDDFDGASVGSGNVGTQALTDADGWVRLSGTMTKVGIANYAIIRVVTDSSTNTDVFYVDGVLIEKDSLGTYFDGGAGGFWSGTANDSISGATPY